MTRIRCRLLTPDLWPDLERLFGPQGACDGCWCMWWRHGKGEDWPAMKGAANRRRFRRLVLDGQAHGVLAYADNEPVGWLSFDRRTDFPRLQRARTLKADDAGRVWSLPCFYVRSGWRGQGVAAALLAHALRYLEQQGAGIVEGYPVRPPADGRRPSAAAAFTGTLSLFAAAGFRPVGDRDAQRQRMRRRLRRPQD